MEEVPRPGKGPRPLRRIDRSRIIPLMASSTPTAGRPWAPPSLALDADRIVQTVEILHRRIDERFPGSGLGGVCVQLWKIGEQTRDRLAWVAKPILYLRAATWLASALVVVAVVAAFATLRPSGGALDALDAVQLMESGLQDAVFIGVGLFFLVSLENRIKRRRALGFIRELRALAHIVDMHQLTKDPNRVLHDGDTASSPKRTLRPDQLARYLDYCTEMLSLTSKVAALYAERFDDSVVLQAVDEVEALTTGLSRKIWQKIMLLDQPVVPAPSSPVEP